MARLSPRLLCSLALLAAAPLLAPPPARCDSTALRGPVVKVAKSPVQAAEAPESTSPGAAAKRAAKALEPPEAKGSSGSSASAFRTAQLPMAITDNLSPVELIDRAFDYEWYGNLAAMRACLEAAGASPPSRETGLALALLIERAAADGDAAGAQAALEQVQAGYTDPEVLAFASMEQALTQAADGAAREVILTDYLEEEWGTLTGGWVALRLGRIYQDGEETGAEALRIFESTAQLYAGSLIGEEAALGIADTARRRGVGGYNAIEVYSTLLETTTSDRLQRWTTEGMAYRLMGLGQWQTAYDLLSGYVERWPLHANYKCVPLLGQVALRLGTAGPLEPGIRAALPLISGSWHQAEAHYVLGELAFLRRDLDAAESEFAAAAAAGWSAVGNAGVAECRAARGDLAGALLHHLKAAEGAVDPCDRVRSLYAAAMLAETTGDRTTFDETVARMVAEFPGSAYTTRLVGYEILSVPEN